MTLDQETYDALVEIAEGDGFQARVRLRKLIPSLQVTSAAQPPENAAEGQIGGNKEAWTGNQRNASWLYMTQKAEQLNDAGLDMRVVLKPTYQISWTKENFHDHVWIPIQKALFGTDSMTKLEKDQPGRVHAIIERELNQAHGVEYIPFPNFNMRLEAVANLKNDNYPDYNGPPTI